MSKSTKTTSTSVNKTAPLGFTQPFLKGGLSDLSKWYASDFGTQPYPGSTVVPFSPFTNQAQGMIASRAMNGSPLIKAAQNQLLNTVQGNFLNPSTNMGLRQTNEQANNAVRSRLGSEFGGAMSQGSLDDQSGQLGTMINGGAYQPERMRQMQAMLFAPQMANQDYTDAAQLAGVGQAQQGQAQNFVNDAMNRYNFQQNAPLQKIQQFLGPVQGIGEMFPSSTNTSTGSQPGGGIASAIGTAASLASLIALL